MPAEVKILVEGYTNADLVAETGEEKSCATITLVKEGDLVMVVDPGVLENQQILIDALENENLTVDDVNIVCITHSHLDHYRNIGMFPEAKILEYFGLWEKDTVEEWKEQFSSHIQILKTPGHDYTSITLFVSTESGIVAICGDVFWRENYPKEDAYATDPQRLHESRSMVLEMADWIIPGHGPMYKIKKDQPQDTDESGGAVEEKELKIFLTCKKCHKLMGRKDRCMCRPWLCHRCCECGLDCDLCGCSHKKELS